MKKLMVLSILAFSFQALAAPAIVNISAAPAPSDKAVVNKSATEAALKKSGSKGKPCTTGRVRSFPDGTVLQDNGFQFTCNNGIWKGHGLN